MKVCQNCEAPHDHSTLLCGACYSYQRRHNAPRPKTLQRPSIARNCGNCGQPMQGRSELCSLCRQFLADNGTMRPQYLWGGEHLCTDCGKPTTRRSPICDECSYLAKNYRAKEAAKLRYHDTKAKKCDCGQPAVIWHRCHIIVDGGKGTRRRGITLPMCPSCWQLEISEYPP